MEDLQNQIDGFVHADWLSTTISAVIILIATAIVSKLVTRFLRHLLRFNEGKNLPSSSIFVNIARGTIWVLGLCIMLSTCFNVDVSAAVAALGIGGIAISLGFQDTISNLIGGLQVSLLRIVKPGDNIEVGSSTGVVKDIMWRHTTIRNFKGEVVIVPNSIINKTALVHLPPTNQVSLPVIVTTDGARLNDVAKAIERTASEAAGAIGTLTKEPQLSFSEILESGFKGVLVFRMADSRDAAKAGDIVLRAIAPLTRQRSMSAMDESVDCTKRSEGEEGCVAATGELGRGEGA